MKRLIVFLCLCSIACLSRAETRWCSTVGGNSSSHFFYPAMARMEKIQGVVIGRVTILPNGKVELVEIVSGPPVLAKALHDQMMKWTLRTETDNDESCQTLVIADFKMSSPYGKNLLDEPKPAVPGVLRLVVEADPETDAPANGAPDRADAQGAKPPDNLESSSRRP
jgi:Gram-negative bacterial TonB protein C-terminal